MARRLAFLIAVFFTLALSFSAQAQDALNLPADLYILLNNGQIQRFGVGASGVMDLTPPGLFIVDFGVDSLGQQIAFRTEGGLYTINVASGGAPVQLEGATADVPPYRGAGNTISWSPNGDALAYTTTYGARIYFNSTTPTFFDLTQSPFKGLSWSPGGRFLAAEAESAANATDNVWWIYRRDGAGLTLTSAIPSSIGTAWVSDSELVFAPAEGGLRLMNLDQANAQVVLLDESVTYRLPEINTADALVFFGRDPNDKNVPDGYGRLLRLARGAQKLETIGEVPISLNGLLWAPGGSLLVAFQGGVIALYDPSTGLGFPLPMTDLVAYAWGPTAQAGQTAATPAPVTQPTQVPVSSPTEINQVPVTQATESSVTLIPVVTQGAPQATPLPVSTVTALTLSADAFFLAPDSRGVVQVWKMPRGGTPPQPFTGSGTDVNEFAVAPDGHTVAYVVDAELWLQQDVQQPKLLARINSFAPVEAAFSADATKIAYVDERSGVWIDVIADNAPQLLRSNGDGETYHRPQYSPDGNSLLVDVYGSSGNSIGVLNLTTRDLIASTPAAADDPRPLQTHWLQDGRIYSSIDANSQSSVAPGFYILDATLSNATPAQWVPIPASVTVRDSIEAVPGSLRVVSAGGTEAFAPLSVTDYDLSNGQSKPLMGIGSVIAPQISPDGRFVGGYESLTQIDGIQQGAILVVDLDTGRRFLLSNPATAWGFRWAAP